MKHCTCLFFVAVVCVSEARAQGVSRTIPYATAHERQVHEVHAPPGAKNLPVVFWIHGGGWQTGDKSMAALKPKAFMDTRRAGSSPRSCARTIAMRKQTAMH